MINDVIFIKAHFVCSSTNEAGYTKRNKGEHKNWHIKLWKIGIKGFSHQNFVLYGS